MSNRHRLVIKAFGQRLDFPELSVFVAQETRREQTFKPMNRPPEQFYTGSEWNVLFDVIVGTERDALVILLKKISGGEIGYSAAVDEVWDFDNSTVGAERTYCFKSVSFRPYLGLDVDDRPAPFSFFAGKRDSIS